jgi:hypothetical protein
VEELLQSVVKCTGGSVKHPAIHTGDKLVHNSFRITLSLESFKRHKSPDTDQILIELIKTGKGNML